MDQVQLPHCYISGSVQVSRSSGIHKPENKHSSSHARSVHILRVYGEYVDLYDHNSMDRRYYKSVDPCHRQTIINEFNDPESDIFCLVMTSRVGGVGLNIHGASRAVIFEPDWNPGQGNCLSREYHAMPLIFDRYFLIIP